MIPYDPRRHHRRSIRLKGYDYAGAGAYFVTLCTKDRACLFRDIVDGLMVLNEAGRVVEECWKDIPAHFHQIIVDAFVVMPNHIHGILRIVDAVGGERCFAHVGLGQMPRSYPPIGNSEAHPSIDVGAKDVSPLRVGHHEHL